MKISALPTLALFLALATAGVNRAAAQTAAKAPVRPSVPAQTPVQPTTSGNPSNQIANHAAQTKVVRVYRGEGYFDAALADKLRQTLATNKSADQKEAAEAGRP